MLPALRGTRETAAVEDAQVHQAMLSWRRDSGWTTDPHIPSCFGHLDLLISPFSKRAISSRSISFGRLIRPLLDH